MALRTIDKDWLALASIVVCPSAAAGAIVFSSWVAWACLGVAIIWGGLAIYWAFKRLLIDPDRAREYESWRQARETERWLNAEREDSTLNV